MWKRGKNFTWCQDMSLKELILPENIKKIKDSFNNKKVIHRSENLADLFDEEDDENNKCTFCHV
jgi:hypothetical protein